MDYRIIIIFIIIIILGILGLVYITMYNNIQAYKIRINEAESIIDDLLRKKYDSLNLIKDIIIEETKLPKKTFHDYLELKNINISSFDLDRKLTDYYLLITKIKDDYNNLNKNIRFTNYYENIYSINEKLEAAKSFYNKYTTLLNKNIKKFPSNIIAKIHKIKVQSFFDGKDMFDDDIKDFKL